MAPKPAQYEKIAPPRAGTKISVRENKLVVPDDPIIPFIQGDGIGPDIWAAAQHVFDGAVRKAYGGKRKIVWFRVYAGRDALELYGNDAVLPDDTVNAIRDFYVAIKGPLTTPVGGFDYVCLTCSHEQNGPNGKRPAKCAKCDSEFVTPRFRSLNVTLRQVLDLYACVRPVRWIRGVPSPVKAPEKLDVIIFRENTEDVYAGIEWATGTPQALKLIEFLDREMGKRVRPDSGIGVKPISETASKRLIRMAIRQALANNRKTLTLVHKGNIMKFTEGAFRDWGYELAKTEFRDQIVTEEEYTSGASRENRLLVNDRIADSVFQQILTRTREYDVFATPNLNGDYLSDACAGQVGGLGMAPGANVGDEIAFFEATHGTAPKYAGKDIVNPGSVMLSGVMMLKHLGWGEAATTIEAAIGRTIQQKKVTYDLARQMAGATELKTSEFADSIIANM